MQAAQALGEALEAGQRETLAFRSDPVAAIEMRAKANRFAPGVEREDLPAFCARDFEPEAVGTKVDDGERRVDWTKSASGGTAMKAFGHDLRVRQQSKVRLAKWPTTVEPVYASKDEYRALLEQQVDHLSSLQERLYASSGYAVLVILQGMDTAGKDGVIKHVLTGVNPQGCEVTSFKAPSATEAKHDFLWRTACRLPERGRIGIFNRSYYEEVVAVRVHPSFLHAQNVPAGDTAGGKLWRGRYRSIVDFEHHLARNGTVMLKFFLHLSRDEQAKRLIERVDDPDKRWKFNPADVVERGHWEAYVDAWERCIAATSTGRAPWYVVPADDKPNARLLVASVIADTLDRLDLRYPPAEARSLREMRRARTALAESITSADRRTG